jgi:hypothetical protein
MLAPNAYKDINIETILITVSDPIEVMAATNKEN